MNISLKELVKLVDINYKKYNKNEKKFIKGILVLLSQDEMTVEQRGVYLYEFNKLLDELNPLLDKCDENSKINRSIVDEKMLYLRNQISDIIQEKIDSEIETKELAEDDSMDQGTKEDAELVEKISSVVKDELEKNKTVEETQVDDSLDVDSETRDRLVGYFDSKDESKSSEDVNLVRYEENDSVNSDTETKRIKIEKGILVVSSVALVISLLAAGYVIARDARSGKIKDNKPTKSTSDTLDRNSDNNVVNNYDSENNELLVVETEKPELIDIFADDEFEPLTTENFEVLVSDYANKYNKEYEGIVTTKDIVKFVAITNIDMLSEDNRELANQLFGEQSKEEYLNDAAKLIGATVMYNFTKWNAESNTENFIRVSDLVYGEQKDKMLKIEDYTDKIASAVNMDDKELVNKIVDEFLTDMNSGSLSKLDDGVGFAAQVNIAVIADGIARNYLNKQNFDMFQVLKTSEKYVSNIFTEYEECANGKDDAKTLIK